MSQRICLLLCLVVSAAPSVSAEEAPGAPSPPTDPSGSALAPGGSPPTPAGELGAQPATEPVAPPAAPPPWKKKVKYALPFMLRPAIAPNVARIDGTLAPQTTAFTGASILTAGGKPFSVLPDLGLYGRFGVVGQHTATLDGVAATNPLLFGLWTPEIASGWRLPVFLGFTLPVGMGGGDAPNPVHRPTIGAGIYARQAMDNALMATNYMTVTGGVGIAWLGHGVTAQAEVTLLELIRTRGETVDLEPTRTNLTAGLHVGYLIFDWLTASTELHVQRWLVPPAGALTRTALLEQATVGLGVRANIPLTDSVLIRPGVGVFFPLDSPMTTSGYNIVQLDVPVVF